VTWIEWLVAFGRRRPDLVAGLTLVLMPFGLLGRALLPGKVLSPADNLLSAVPWATLAPGHAPANRLLLDVTLMFHPWTLYAADRIWRADFPLWNPHSFGGAPFFANPQTALLFPLTAPAYVLPGATALGLIAVLKLVVAGVGMYWFLRLLSPGPLAAFGGALTYMLGAMLTVWLMWPLASVMSMVPVLFGATELVRRRGDSRSVAALAVATALTLLAGYPQTAFHAGLAATLYAAARARTAMAGARTFIGRFLLGGALGTGLAMVQILPFLEYARESAVFAYRGEWMPVANLPPHTAVTFLMPFYYGHPNAPYWGPWNFNELAVSVGLVPWLLLPVAMSRRPRGDVAFFVALGALAGSLAYGAPVLTPAIASRPPFSLASNQRLLTLLVFSLCVLLALGLEAPRSSVRAGRTELGVKAVFGALVFLAFGIVAMDLFTLAPPAHRIGILVQHGWFLVLLTAAALLVLRFVRDGGRALGPRAGLVVVQVACLLPVSAMHNPVIDARLLYPTPPALRALQTQADPGRVWLPEALNVGALYRLDEITGYDGMTPRRIEQLVGPGSVGHMGNGPLQVTSGLTSPLIDLLGVRHVVQAPGTPSPGSTFSLEYDGPDARIYRNDRAFPRAFLVFGARPCVDGASALRVVRDRALDLSQHVVLSDCAESPAVGPPGRVATLEVTERRAERLRLTTTTDAPAYLVLIETWFPGWRARVDGIEQPIWRANYAFRAVWLPAGRHEVDVAYQPRSVTIGLMVSAIAGLLILGLCLGGGRRRG
jgi:hypothetical protein